MKKVWLRAVCTGALVSMMLAGCGNGENQSETIYGLQTAGREKRIEQKQLIAAIGEEPETGFDPSSGGHGSMTKIFFSTLFTRDKELGWSNDLAEGYEVSEDRRTWTVTIREDVFFTDGNKVSANDVAFTYQTAKDTGLDIDLTMIKSIEVIDDTTVAFHLTRTYSAFLERLAYLGIVPEYAYDESFKDHPIGSGPYRLVQWDKGQQIIAVANENYYGTVPQLKQLTLVFLDKDAALAAMQSGTIDVAVIDGTRAGTKVSGAYVENIDSIECYGICFPMVLDVGEQALDNTEMGNNVTADRAVRLALNTAIDREKIVTGILNGYGTVSTTGLEKMPWLNEDTVLEKSEYGNIDKARAIISEGGWTDTDGDGIVEKDGVRAEFKLLYTEGSYRQEMALEFVNTAKAIGIEVTLEKVTWDTILPKIHNSAVLYGFGSGDPSELYNLYYGGAYQAVPWDNGGCYDNQIVNALIDQALDSVDEQEALVYWKEIQQYTSAKGDIPYCWLVNVNHVYLCADGFSFGDPATQPHGGRIFDNVTEWAWDL